MPPRSTASRSEIDCPPELLATINPRPPGQALRTSAENAAQHTAGSRIVLRASAVVQRYAWEVEDTAAAWRGDAAAHLRPLLSGPGSQRRGLARARDRTAAVRSLGGKSSSTPCRARGRGCGSCRAARACAKRCRGVNAQTRILVADDDRAFSTSSRSCCGGRGSRGRRGEERNGGARACAGELVRHRHPRRDAPRFVRHDVCRELRAESDVADPDADRAPTRSPAACSGSSSAPTIT